MACYMRSIRMGGTNIKLPDRWVIRQVKLTFLRIGVLSDPRLLRSRCGNYSTHASRSDRPMQNPVSDGVALNAGYRRRALRHRFSADSRGNRAASDS
jgi:hypothetical protein